MGSISGGFVSVTFFRSRLDYVRVRFTPADSYGEEATFSLADGAAVTIDGKPVADPGDLILFLTGDRNVEVTVHPCPARYGVSLKTEFREAA